MANPRMQGSLLLVVLIAGIALVGYLIATPLLQRENEFADANERTRRFISSSARAETSPPVDTSMAIYSDQPPATKTLDLQRKLVEEAKASGLQLRQMSSDNPREMDLGLVRLTYDLDLHGDLGHWTDFMQRLAQFSPAVFVDDVIIRADEGMRPDLRLNIRTHVSAYVRFGGEAP